MQRTLLVFATVIVCLAGLLVPARVLAQQATAVLTGTVTDPTGARIPGATLHLAGKAAERDITSDSLGRFSIHLGAGTYALTVSAEGFVTLNKGDIRVGASGRVDIPLTLAISAESAEVNVNASDTDTTESANNRSALTLSGKTLATLSDDDTVFQQQIQEMAGGGDSGSTSLYVDGFSGGRFPPKTAIREVRINSNPFSSEYDSLGFGRIEVFTKPGADKLHGFFDAGGNDQSFNARNPYTGAQPPYHDLYFDGNLSGPIGPKTSFFVSVNRTDQQNNAVVNAVTDTGPLSQAVPNPQNNNTVSVRLDRQMTANNVLTGRYEWNNAGQANSGVGLLVLPSEGVTTGTTTQTLQLSDSESLGASTVIETRFEYIRTRMRESPNSTDPTLIVQGSFSGGGSAGQASIDNQDHYELQEYISRVFGKHLLRAGGRFRLNRDANTSTGGYNGAFTFPSLTAYQITLAGIAQGLTPEQIRANGGGASQFNLTAGVPSAAVSSADVAVYAEDEWKARKDLTVNYGVRFESQTAIPDNADPAPRVGVAYSLSHGKSKSPLAVFRGGFGVFYDRFALGNLLTAVRQNGTSQLAYYIQNPDFYPNVPADTSTLPSTQPTVYSVSPRLRVQYLLVESVSAEHSFGEKGSISLTYLNRRGDHQYLSRNVNAPLPGTFDPSDPTSGTRPFPTDANLYQFSSDGISRSHALFGHMNVHPTKSLYAYAFFNVLNRTGDTSGAGSFPSNEYNLKQDYGRQAQTRLRAFAGAWYSGPKGVEGGLFLAAHSGVPFNITTGTDLNGDTQFNDRPSFATDLSRPSVVKTNYGTFDTNPIAGQMIIPINYGLSPAFASLELDASKVFHFGPRPAAVAPPPGAPAGEKPEPPEPKYALRFGVEADNALNHTNPGVPVGVLTSPYFGKSISLASQFTAVTAANRTVTLHANFSF